MPLSSQSSPIGPPPRLTPGAQPAPADLAGNGSEDEVVEGQPIDVDVEECDRVAPEVEQEVVADLHGIIDDPGDLAVSRCEAVHINGYLLYAAS
jgi:hypothetical protein